MARIYNRTYVCARMLPNTEISLFSGLVYFRYRLNSEVHTNFKDTHTHIQCNLKGMGKLTGNGGGGVQLTVAVTYYPA